MIKGKVSSLQFVTILVSASCMFVMAMTLLASTNMQNLLTLWGEEVQVTMYLKEEVSSKDQIDIENNLSKIPEVSSFQLVTQQEAIELLRVQMAGLTQDLTADEELLKLVPATYVVGIDNDLDPAKKLEATKKVASELLTWPGVEDVSYGQDWVEKYSGIVTTAKALMLGLGLLVLIAAVFIFSNAVRASVDQRRYEIEVLELVGATPWKIRSPFLREGAFLGVFSSMLALIFSGLVYVGAKDLMQGQPALAQLADNLSFLSPLVLVLFVFIGLVLGVVGSYLSVVRINTGWAASER